MAAKHTVMVLTVGHRLCRYAIVDAFFEAISLHDNENGNKKHHNDNHASSQHRALFSQ